MVRLILSDQSYAELLVAVEEQVELARSFWKHSEPPEEAEAKLALDRAMELNEAVQRGSRY